jgi:hypothetical protein
MSDDTAKGPWEISDEHDDRLFVEATERLVRSEHRSVKRLRLEVVDAVIILVGTVRSEYLKHVAQAAVSHIPGSLGVVNLVEVE